MLYTYFLKVYKYYLFQMGFLGIRFAYYISQKPLFQSIYKFLFLKRPRKSDDILIEPIENHWLCKSQLQSIAPPPSSSSSRFSSRFSLFSRSRPSSSSLSSSFKLKEEYFISLDSYEENLQNIGENDKILITYSIPMVDNYIEKIFRIIRTQPFSFTNLEEPKICSVSFLDIQYHHPEMKDSLILEIPREWCCVGNELFTPEFVLRVLYYQTLPFVFDMHYTLDIMDNELNIFQLDSKQHLFLKEKSYDVVLNNLSLGVVS